jgi:hypothetical protein
MVGRMIIDYDKGDGFIVGEKQRLEPMAAWERMNNDGVRASTSNIVSYTQQATSIT